jgi:hypothetical protein
MKKINVYIIVLASLALGFTACNDSFMEEYPETTITVPGFFKTAEDLKTYVNGLYNDVNLMSEGAWMDPQSDNITMVIESNPTWNMIHGILTPENVIGWDGWGSLRSVNLMLNNLQNVSGQEDQIRNYIGIARYFRAWFYINKVFSYSDVPWYNKPLETNDPEIFKAADPRTLVVDSIMADLEYASANISADMGNKTRVHKYCALTLLSRFSLYEGTYRKYHPELNLASSANTFLQRAVSASEEVINSKQFEITGGGTLLDLGNGITGSQGFRDLFCALDLSGNREIIQWVEYRYPNRSFGARAVLYGTNCLSRSLQESFLTKSGAPFSTVAGYDEKTFGEVFVNRDPRMAETLVYPGCLEMFENIHITRPDLGGYDQSKAAPREPTIVNVGGGTYGAAVTYRYAEVLLNYAEAKAELGGLVQADIDKSINLLRDRVAMPHFDAVKEVDNDLKELYPNISDNNILAVRRERRVELAGEGHRERDLYRWAAGHLFTAEKSKQGIYIPALGPYDVTGDGINDIAIVATAADKDNYPSEPANVRWYYLDDPAVRFKLPNGKGHIVSDYMVREFKNPQYYYRPIPVAQIILNPNLKQPFGW